jgi:hypothetical protein
MPLAPAEQSRQFLQGQSNNFFYIIPSTKNLVIDFKDNQSKSWEKVWTN